MLETFVKKSSPLPLKSKILIFGGGFSGQHIAKLGRKLGAEVLCSRRSKTKAKADFVFDSSTSQLPPKHIFNEVTHIISCIPPGKNGKDPVLEHLLEDLKKTSLKWIGYISTTGVYGDTQGKWVDESHCPKPEQSRSKRRFECENEWKRSGLPVQILRLPGIYGPGRSAIDSIINNKYRLIDKPGQIFSRIHIDDIAGSIMHLITLSEKNIRPNIINISDNLPSSNIDVLLYAAKLMNKISLPPIEPFEKASKEMSPMALSFWQENRKISNKLLCKDLNYSLIHPNYESGLKEYWLKLKNN